MRRVFICAATNLLRWTTCNIITYTSGVISFETKSSYSSRMGPRFNLPTRFSSTSGVKPRLKQTCLIDDFPLDQSICRTLLAGERFQWQTRMRINPRQYVHNPTSSITFVEPSVGENNTFALTFTAHRRKRDKYWLEPIGKAITKFKAKPTTYCLIPCIAAIVGWVTNWLAVQMIFYPIQYRGFSLIRKDEVPLGEKTYERLKAQRFCWCASDPRRPVSHSAYMPCPNRHKISLGLLGWQGIVPCKTRTMSETMVNMVTTQLLSVPKLFKRLNPRRMADLLAPEVPKIVHEVMADIAPSWIASVPKDMYCGLTQRNRELLQHLNHKFLIGFAKDIQGNVVKVFSVRNCVVDQMLQDRTMLGKLFQKCGSKELQFLTDSGLWFGFLLGILQMLVALFWENPWSLSIGGLIVGFATNWLALKWIFEPVS